jgi:hypothetical protein
MLPKRGERFPNRDGKGSAGLSYPRATSTSHLMCDFHVPEVKADVPKPIAQFGF